MTGALLAVAALVVAVGLGMALGVPYLDDFQTRLDTTGEHDHG